MYIPLWIGKQELSPWFGNKACIRVCVRNAMFQQRTLRTICTIKYFTTTKNYLISSWYRSTVN